MAAIITEKFRVHNARQFKEDFGEAASNTYIFIGRSFAWPNDAVPTAPANAVGEELDAWSDMIALKKVPTADVTHGLVRYNWTQQKVQSMMNTHMMFHLQIHHQLQVQLTCMIQDTL